MTRSSLRRNAAPWLLTSFLVGCAVAAEPAPELAKQQGPSWDEFVAATYLEPWDGGMYIIDGDTPVANLKLLREAWAGLQQGGLIVHREGGTDSIWNTTQRKNLTYCVSTNFGTRKAEVERAMATAAGRWEGAANVNFVYASANDAKCTASNTNVVFNVRQVSGQSYLARAFFPYQPRGEREVLVDTSAFDYAWPLENVITHELGHTLGFRHEHTRPESGKCFEDSSWRALTGYDRSSVMHYPQCNGNPTLLAFAATDAAGAAALYGKPGSGSTPAPKGVWRAAYDTRSLGESVQQHYQPFAVVPGSTFTVTMSGSGDPDLYVRFGSAPSTSSWDCRPYGDGASETCNPVVPAGVTSAYVMVRAFTASTYRIDVKYLAPN